MGDIEHNMCSTNKKHIEQYMVTYVVGYIEHKMCSTNQITWNSMWSHFGQDVVIQQIAIYRTHLTSCHTLHVHVMFCKRVETMLNCCQWVHLSIILSRHQTKQTFVCYCSLGLLKHVG